jgi:parallel beta-helix repeat protein
VVIFQGGGGNGLDNNHIFNKALPPPGRRSAGVYLMCSQCSGNVIFNNNIHSNFLGVIFGWPLGSAANAARGNRIHDNKCDSISLAAYGEVSDNVIERNGWDCENGPIPGGGIYTEDNRLGARIVGNTLRNNCGSGLDLVRSANLHIEGNTVTDPGYQWGGLYSYCNGAAGAGLLDISNSVIRGNVILNEGRPTNAVGRSRFGDPNGIFSADLSRPPTERAFEDLPHGRRQAIAFWLASDRNREYPTIHNILENNTFRANCGPATECVGLGYFSSRDTGFRWSVNPQTQAWEPAWSAETTNYYTGNDPYGSQYGSKRCGGNWYAANWECVAGSPAPCNQDDYQHNPPAGDWMRSDPACRLWQ